MKCPGDYEEYQDCGTESCPVAVDCQWSDWTKEGGCSKTCGGGIQKWSRHKLQESENGGLPCSGDVTRETSCNTQSCPG